MIFSSILFGKSKDGLPQGTRHYMKIKKITLETFRKAVRPILRRGIGRFYLTKIIHKFLINFFNPIEVDGHKMFIEPGDGLELLIKPTHEQYEVEFFKKEVKKGDTVLDLGAHIGYYTIFAAELVGAEGKVFAFEPEPNNFYLLKKNIEINNYRNVIPVQKAVSDKTGKGRLYLKEKKTQNRIYDSQEKDPFIEIETVKLDDYIEEKIDFIKMDIEGSEMGAVRGMVALLKKNQRVKIMTEFYPALIKKSGENPLDLLKLFKKCGFLINKINDEEKKIEPINYLEEISEIEGHINLFCFK